MRLSLMLLSTILAASTAAISQQTLPGAHPSASLQPAPASDAQLELRKSSAADAAACPLGLNVRFASAPLLSNAARQQRQIAGPEQQIDVNLRNLGLAEVVAVDAHVQGIPGVLRVKLLGDSMVPTAQASTAPVPFHTDNKMQAHSELSLRWTLPNVTGVEWVQVDRVTYADGQVWRRRGADVCKVAPGLMRVN